MVELITPSDDVQLPYWIDFENLRFCRFYISKEEALMLADWFDLVMGGQSDYAEAIRGAVE